MLAKALNIPFWKICDEIGISEPTMSRWMRKYDAIHYRKILKAIEQIEPEKFKTFSEMFLKEGSDA